MIIGLEWSSGVMKKYFKNILLILSLSMVVLYFSIRDNAQEVFETISRLSMIDLLIVMGAFSIVVITETLMYYYFARNYKDDYRFQDALVVQQTGYFGNAVTPFASGGQVFQAMIYKKQNIGYEQSGHMLYMFFIINQISIIIFAAIALIFGKSMFLQEYFIFFNFFIIAFAINVTIILGMFLLSRYKRLHDFITNNVLVFLHKLRVVKDLKKQSEKIEDTLEKFRQEFKNRQLYVSIAPKLLVLSAIRFIVFYSMPFVAIAVISHDVSLQLYISSFLCTAFIYNIVGLIPIPGASGGIEGMFLIMFSNANVFGTTFGYATTAVIVWRIITYYLPLLTGALIFSYTTNKKTETLIYIDKGTEE